MKIHDNKGVFDSPNTQIVDSFNIYQQKPPPPDHPNAITCVQCDGLTWRMTDRCIHCNFDMAAHTQEQLRLEQLEQLRLERNQLYKKALQRFALMLVPAAALILLGLSEHKHYATYWVLLAAIIATVIYIAPVTQKMQSISHQINRLSYDLPD